MIRDDAERHMLFNLDQSRVQSLRMQLGDQHEEVVKLTNLYHNLMRMGRALIKNDLTHPILEIIFINSRIFDFFS